MPNAKLLVALPEMRREIVELREARIARLHEQTDALNHAEANLTIARNRQDEALVRRRQRELEDSRTRLSIAIAHLKASDKDLRDTDAQIPEVRG
jgi:hypothetical protein